MTKEYAPKYKPWMTTGRWQDYLKLVARARAGRQCLLDSLGNLKNQADLPPGMVDKTTAVMKESWAEITALLALGGAITSKGEIFASGLGEFNFPQPAVLRLDEEVILQGTLRQLEEELDLPKRFLGTGLQTKTKLALIAPGANMRLAREQTTGQATQFSIVTGSDMVHSKLITEGFIRSFEQFVAGKYSGAGLADRHLVGPGSIVVSLFYDLSRYSLTRAPWSGRDVLTPL